MAEVKQQEKEKAGKVFKPTKRESATHSYINWKSPSLWPLIDQAAKQQVGKPNLTNLIKQLRQQDPRFNHLNYQCISEWRDALVKDKIVWSEKTLKEVKKGFLPGGIQTRFDIFVSIFYSLIYISC
jgi:hypothetical protein